MRRIRVYPIQAMAVVIVLVAASGCATVSSIDVPWKKQSDRSSAATTTETSDSAEATTDEAPVADATYWARKAVTASNQIAYAQHLRSVSRTQPELFAAKKQDLSSPTASTGAADDEHGARKREPSPASPATRSVARKGDDDGDASDNETAEPSEPQTSPQNEEKAKKAPETADKKTVADSEDADSETSSDDGPPSFRTVRRSDEQSTGSQPDVWPVALRETYGSTERGHTPVDPTLDTKVFDLTKSEARKAISKRFGIEVPDKEGATAIPGTFLKPGKFEEYKDNEFDGFDGITEEQKQKQVAIIVPGERVAVYAGEDRIASRTFDAEADLPDALNEVRPIRVIDDGTIQLLAYWPETKKESETVRYKAGILKLIGPYVGTLFEETVAERPAKASELQRKGYVDFVRGGEEMLLRWIPADEQGKPNLNGADILEWNRWEGVFRVPKTPPTAPDQTS